MKDRRESITVISSESSYANTIAVSVDQTHGWIDPITHGGAQVNDVPEIGSNDSVAVDPETVVVEQTEMIPSFDLD
jgi:hypothetical protein